jgi:hypothetical protein
MNETKLREGVDLEQYIKISADSISELRKADVYRVISSIQSDNLDGVSRNDLATFIATKRSDLVAEVTEVMREDFPQDGWAAGCVEQKVQQEEEERYVEVTVPPWFDDKEHAIFNALDSGANVSGAYTTSRDSLASEVSGLRASLADIVGVLLRADKEGALWQALSNEGITGKYDGALSCAVKALGDVGIADVAHRYELDPEAIRAKLVVE